MHTACPSTSGYGVRSLLLQSDHPTLLVTWGVWQPKVILPAEARGWPEDRIRIVLAHELAHVRRGDWLVQLAAELLRAIYWFNPLLWIACRQLRRESEHACDDAVLALGVEGADVRDDAARSRACLHDRIAARSFLRQRWRARPASKGESAPC